MKKAFVLCFALTMIITLLSVFTEVDVLAEGWWSNQTSFGFIDKEMFSECLIGDISGRVLRCGSDFEPGDYYIFSLWGSNALYGVVDAPNDFSYSYERMIRKIHVEKGQYIMLLDAVLVEDENVDTNNWQKYGVYLVGKDIPAGEYKIETISDRYSSGSYSIDGIMGAYQITKGNPENEPIECNSLFFGTTYITVKEGEYIAINNAEMTLCVDSYGNEVIMPTPTPSPIPTPTPLPTATPTATPTPTPSPTPTATPTPIIKYVYLTPEPTATPTFTPIPTATPTPIIEYIYLTPEPTTAPTSTPIPTSTPTPIVEYVYVTLEPTSTPTSTPLPTTTPTPIIQYTYSTLSPTETSIPNSSKQDFEIDISKCTWVFQNGFYTPVINMNIKNISGHEVESMRVQVAMYEIEKNEIWDEINKQLISSGDIPLRSNYSKSISVKSNYGYKKYVDPVWLPDISYEIYVNGKIYCEGKVEKPKTTPEIRLAISAAIRVKEKLKNPSSIRIREVYIEEEKKTNRKVLFLITAENGFGGTSSAYYLCDNSDCWKIDEMDARIKKLSCIELDVSKIAIAVEE